MCQAVLGPEINLDLGLRFGPYGGIDSILFSKDLTPGKLKEAVHEIDPTGSLSASGMVIGHCIAENCTVRFIFRRQNSLTEKFRALQGVSRSIKATVAVLDGEIVALDKDEYRTSLG